jgi:hypothetical protein
LVLHQPPKGSGRVIVALGFASRAGIGILLCGRFRNWFEIAFAFALWFSGLGGVADGEGFCY